MTNKKQIKEKKATIKAIVNFKKRIRRKNELHRRSIGKTLYENTLKKKRNTLSARKNQSNSLRFIKAIAPQKFNLQYENCVSVIQFINKLKALGNQGHHINIIMDNVTVIGNGAISMLLSVINELSNNGILIKGSKPKNPDAKSILEKSGFFKYLRTIIDDENSHTKNNILRTGDKRTPSSEISEEVHKAMETIWGVKARCPRLYGGIFEMVRNSCDHAFKNSDLTTWHLGLYHEEEKNLVKFSFVDNGKGIIKTFSTGILRSFLNLFEDNTDILRTAFLDGIQSRTGLSWRGKGLPTIFELLTDNIISKLIIITNNVYFDFTKRICVTLPVNYSGTYYYWIIDKKCQQSYFI